MYLLVEWAFEREASLLGQLLNGAAANAATNEPIAPPSDASQGGGRASGGEGPAGGDSAPPNGSTDELMPYIQKYAS